MHAGADKRTRVTILDVAAQAGVSKSTVSRVLDERLPRSEGSTAKKVREVANRLGYVRDNSAASLRRGQTMTIGVIVPRLTDTVMAMLYEEIAKACSRSGQFAIVATTNDNPDAGRQAAETLINRGVDGLILATTRTDDDLPSELKQRGIKFVLALRTNGNNPASVGDDKLGGYLATRHLLDLGHVRIGLISGPPFASSANMRAQGYQLALQEAGIELSPEYIVGSSFSIDSGVEAAEQLMGLDHPPSAIFAINDNTAIGALSALNRMDISVPEHVSLVGYNDIPLVSRLTTPLSTVRVPFDQIATSALELLAGDAGYNEGNLRIATPSLIPRSTTRPPREPPAKV